MENETTVLTRAFSEQSRECVGTFSSCNTIRGDAENILNDALPYDWM